MGSKRENNKPDMQKTPRRKLILEALEQRLLLSADIAFAADLQQEVIFPDQTTISPEFQQLTSSQSADNTFFDPNAVVDNSLAVPYQEALSHYKKPTIELQSGLINVEERSDQLQLLIIDSGIQEYNVLLDDLFAQYGDVLPFPDVLDPDKLDTMSLDGQVNANADASFKIFLLDSKQDGLEQVDFILDQYQEVSAIHLLYSSWFS